jgi:probable phosphoglycerate mutase
MTILIIARHGNTFGPNDTPTRVGARTDLPLVESGRKQAQQLGAWFKQNNISPDTTYSSQLQRTIETASLALQELGSPPAVHPLDIFNEVDYGPDENQTEDKVIARLGKQALQDWDEKAVVPDGWLFDPDQCIQNWKSFAAQMIDEQQGTVFVVTSNGIARFAPYLTNDFDAFAANNKIKLSTGAFGILSHSDTNGWQIQEWNVRP